MEKGLNKNMKKYIKNKTIKILLVMTFFLLNFNVKAINANSIFASITNIDKNTKDTIDNIFNNIKNLNFDNVIKYIEDNEQSNAKNLLKPVSDFIIEYPSSKNSIIGIISKIDYEIKSIDEKNGEKTVKINFTMPDYQKVIEECKVQMIIKNAFKFIKNGFKLDNEILASCLEIINKKVNNDNDIKTINFDYDFDLKKVNNGYKLNNLSKIYNDIELQVVNNISSALNK